MNEIASLQNDNLLMKNKARAMKDVGIQTDVEDVKVQRIPERDPSGENDIEVYSCVLKNLQNFEREHSQMKTKRKKARKKGQKQWTSIWNTEQPWKRLILENHTVEARTKPGLFTTVSVSESRKRGECNPGNWMKEFQWEKWGGSWGGRTAFDPAGHPVEKVQEILNKLL